MDLISSDKTDQLDLEVLDNWFSKNDKGDSGDKLLTKQGNQRVKIVKNLMGTSQHIYKQDIKLSFVNKLKVFYLTIKSVISRDNIKIYYTLYTLKNILMFLFLHIIIQ